MRAGCYWTAERSTPFFVWINISVLVNAFRVIIMNSPAPRFYGPVCALFSGRDGEIMVAVPSWKIEKISPVNKSCLGSLGLLQNERRSGFHEALQSLALKS